MGRQADENPVPFAKAGSFLRGQGGPLCGPSRPVCSPTAPDSGPSPLADTVSGPFILVSDFDILTF